MRNMDADNTTQRWHFRVIIFFLLLHQSTAFSCNSSAIGVANIAKIPNDKMTSSSHFNTSTPPSNGRLRFTSGSSWCSNTSDFSPYLQVDLNTSYVICGVATQGDHKSRRWVQTYQIQTSADGIAFTDYKENNITKVFPGNNDSNTIVQNSLLVGVVGQYVRIRPGSASCMRIELYGVQKDTASTIKISELSNKNLTALRGSHVTLTCKVQEPLVQSIAWSIDGQDVTNLSSGLMRNVTFVKSELQVNYTNASDVFTKFQCSKESSFVICRRKIVCKVNYTKDGVSRSSIQGAEVTTFLEYPSTPSLKRVNNSDIQTTSAEIHWTISKSEAQASNSFAIKYWINSTKNTVNASSSPQKISGLSVCTQYNVSIRAESLLGEGSWSNTLSFRTKSKSPDGVTATPKTSQSILVTWQVASALRCPIDRYRIKVSTTQGGTGDYIVVEGEDTSSRIIPNLKKWTEYHITVQVHNEAGYSLPSAARKQRTLEDKPDAPPTNFNVTATSPTSVNLTWGLPPKDKRNGVIRGFNISYCKTADNTTRITKTLEGSSTLQDVIDGLEMHTEYSFKILAYTSEGNGPYSNEIKERTLEENKSNQSGSGSIAPLVGSLVAVFLVIIIVTIIVGVIFWRKRRKDIQANDEIEMDNVENIEEKNKDVIKSNPNTQSLEDESADMYANAEVIRHQPIHVNKFRKYVNENQDIIKANFKLLAAGQMHPWTVARDPKNKPKNRYANIITYDHSRVVLEDTSNGSDYVNASYIHGFDGTPKTYIATQGPNLLSTPDFWQMVWQEYIKTIVMLTNLIETKKVKCHQYWPDKKDTFETYGKFTVKLHRTDTMADYVVRVFIVCKDGETENRQVYHFQYISWPDKGVPEHATSLLGFRKKARSHYLSCGSTGRPLLVHCSAGVGRTGAFLAIDAMMEKVKKDKTIDILNYVQLMRENRCTMIQTEEQFLFVYRALQEAITCGNTEITVIDLNIAMAKLARPRPKDQQTGYQLEWKRLNAISPKVTNEACETGRQQENLPRNRYQDIIPFDSSRVLLPQEHQNYINASFANAFRERKAFIMTQAPLENTISDFWLMVHQYKIGSIVMLNKLQEENESFLQYWPKESSDTYNGIIVEVIHSESCGPLVVNKCILTHLENFLADMAK
ncbi:receptor-type tyrosine-protein phosphatase F isoform X1 [Exaiptasia diaphana]|uniref:Protein-tyrosine-phosphatase n=1 Tax=Exaiptasia diaphana TaxID=2652724 RepID=A0A913XYW8_EXADI|nr:receptor-type tyrosine-protein phosphatase F isoform X1 [Exaiptasia diaphana]